MLWLVPLLLVLLASALVLAARVRRRERALATQATEQLGRLHRRADALAQRLRRFDRPEPGRDAGAHDGPPPIPAERPPIRRRAAASPPDSEFASP